MKDVIIISLVATSIVSCALSIIVWGLIVLNCGFNAITCT